MSDKAYRNYLLGVLLLILAFNQVDRLAHGLLMQDIKVELALSDTQLGLLTGIAFAFFYSIMGIPIARWADRGNRVAIISVTTALWSVAVAMCGMAGNFVQLLLIRVGVAVGEAGCVPPAHSLIADHFTRAERPRATAIYMLGAPLSAVIGYFAAGWLNQYYGWRTTLVVLGLPGIGLAALAWFTLREPRREKPTRAPTSTPDFRNACAVLVANASFRHLLMGYAVLCFFSYGIGQWKSVFFMRSYGLETGELGSWLALVYGFGALVGTVAGGELASRLAAGNEALQLKFMAVVFCGFGLISAGVYGVGDFYLALALLTIAVVGINMAMGPLFATIQTLVPGHLRALSIALVYLAANLIGLGLGPLAAGVISDALAPHFGQESLRYALLVLCPGYAWAGWHLWRGGRSVMADIHRGTDA